MWTFVWNHANASKSIFELCKMGKFRIYHSIHSCDKKLHQYNWIFEDLTFWYSESVNSIWMALMVLCLNVFDRELFYIWYCHNESLDNIIRWRRQIFQLLLITLKTWFKKKKIQRFLQSIISNQFQFEMQLSEANERKKKTPNEEMVGKRADFNEKNTQRLNILWTMLRSSNKKRNQVKKFPDSN